MNNPAPNFRLPWWIKGMVAAFLVGGPVAAGIALFVSVAWDVTKSCIEAWSAFKNGGR